MTYEFMEQFVITGAFGMMIALYTWAFVHWIISLVEWLRRKVKKNQV